MLRELPDAALQFLLASSVTLLRAELATNSVRLGECISMDTKHIIAWVKENNPKAYVSHRYDKTQQPTGDPDCKLGCKRRHNQRAPGTDGQAAPPTPTHNPRPAETIVGRRVLLGLRLRRGRHQGARLGRVRAGGADPAVQPT